MFELKKRGTIEYLLLNEFTARGVKAYFSTRKGGVSSGDYFSLNLGFHTKDKYKNVLQNRKLLCESLNLNQNKLVCGEQVHGNRIHKVVSEDAGRGSKSMGTSLPGVDALITNEKDLPLFSFFADCVPIFLFDPQKEAIGLAHAGWKGTVLKVGLNTLYHMNLEFGTTPSSVWVGLGPAICGFCYEVDEKVVSYFKNVFSFWPEFIEQITEDSYHLDLRKCNELSFRNIGVDKNRIITSDCCTFEQSDNFFSYRGEGKNTGRMAGIIKL